MRARELTPAWGKAAFVSMLVSGCGASDPCTRILTEIEATQSSEAGVIVSDRVEIGGNRRGLARVLNRGTFAPIGHELLHTCLGAGWRGAVEPNPRAGWAAPAIVYSRTGWPNVVLVDDGDKLEIRIERNQL